MAAPGPQPLSSALSELIASRGLARSLANEQLRDTWQEVAGEHLAAGSRPMQIIRGVLQVAVDNAPLLGELNGFHKQSLLATLQRLHPEWKLKDIRFQLKGK